MNEVTTREFTRNFSAYRARAARGERIRVASPDGVFVFQKEPVGLTAREALERVRKAKGIFDLDPMGEKGFASEAAKPAESPWD